MSRGPGTSGPGHATLEALRLSHAAELWPAAADPAIWRFMERPVRRVEDLCQWIDRRVEAARAGEGEAFLVRWAGRAVGCTAMYRTGPASARIGHTFLVPAARGTGLNLAVKRMLLRRAFEDWGLECIGFRADRENVASLRALERLGAVVEAVEARGRQRWDGSWGDMVDLRVLREDWPAVEARLARAAEPLEA